MTKQFWWTLPPIKLLIFIIENILLLAIAGWLWRLGDHEIWTRLEEKYRREEKGGSQDQEKGDSRADNNPNLANYVNDSNPVPP